MANPRFTILLPTHERPDVLPLALSSVLAQTAADLEVLVVGDGCGPATAEAVRSIASADDRVRWFDLPKGPGFGYENRNVALREAEGELVAFMAHDDLWLPDHLELLAAPFDADPEVALAYSQPLWVDPQGTLLPIPIDLGDPARRAEFFARRRNRIPAGCVVHRRAAFERCRGYDARLPDSADMDLWVRIIEGSDPERGVAYVDRPTCLHFRAAWRTRANAGPPELAVWTAVARHSELASGLAVPIPAGRSEQQVLWERIQADPAGFTERLRSDVRRAIHRRLADDDALLAALLAERDQGYRVLALAQEELGRLRARIASEPAPAGERLPPPPPIGWLDEPAPGAVLGPGDPICARGWALSWDRIVAVDVLLDGEPLAAAVLGLPRPDVHAEHPDFPDAARAGFEAVLDRERLTAGEHRLAIRLRGRRGASSTLCERTIVASPPDV